MEIDWPALRQAAVAVMRRAYAPYSNFPVGAAALVDDGRVVVGCNVENASYGVVLCAECGVVSALHATGGGRLVALSCVDARGEPIMPCGRCRQLLWEHGGPTCLIESPSGPLTMAQLLPHAFGPDDLDLVGVGPDPVQVPARVREYQGRGTVFVHPDRAGGQEVWTAYWERSSGPEDRERGILEEAPTWLDTESAVSWGLARTPRVVVVGADGALAWAGVTEPPPEIPDRWDATVEVSDE
jgi:cytidine deaminase